MKPVFFDTIYFQQIYADYFFLLEEVYTDWLLKSVSYTSGVRVSLAGTLEGFSFLGMILFKPYLHFAKCRHIKSPHTPLVLCDSC